MTFLPGAMYLPTALQTIPMMESHSLFGVHKHSMKAPLCFQVQVLASREEIRIEDSVPAVVPQEEDLVTIVQMYKHRDVCSPVTKTRNSSPSGLPLPYPTNPNSEPTWQMGLL